MNYRRGSAFERKVKEMLELEGYYVVRSAGSHGAADLVAVKPGEVLFVQCKTNKISAAECGVLVEVSAQYGAVPVVAVRRGRKTEIYRLV